MKYKRKKMNEKLWGKQQSIKYIKRKMKITKKLQESVKYKKRLTKKIWENKILK